MDCGTFLTFPAHCSSSMLQNPVSFIQEGKVSLDQAVVVVSERNPREIFTKDLKCVMDFCRRIFVQLVSLSFHSLDSH